MCRGLLGRDRRDSGFVSGIDGGFFDMHRVDDADDDRIDRQLFGFRSQASTAALRDQHKIALAGTQRVAGDERPSGGDKRLALFSSNR